MVIFEIKPMSAERYRQRTRRSTLIVALTFALLAMGLAALAVALFGEPGGDNLRWNGLGVAAGLLATIVLVRRLFWSQPWMAEAAYGWQLKRSLMRITNLMHHVKAGVAAGDEQAMKLLRFYHLGVTQMHQLDGNLTALGDLVREIDGHREAMQARGLDIEQERLDDAWLDAVKRFPASR
ncbi:DUF3087 domain-containing protein [Pseudomonas oligotrophica]|uniref:DUF3087 domain-containing protein n=1 Tax=Pseudomonas oligotrophica TaxID=2912055 RepID=UPI001F335373|nr:DUF3087 domain-containing protein [Pseudomonas oligotrophica]MCF7202095.1 DUF3087 domain-containing protein [Pseudomonas oligotrophica]